MRKLLFVLTLAVSVLLTSCTDTPDSATSNDDRSETLTQDSANGQHGKVLRFSEGTAYENNCYFAKDSRWLLRYDDESGKFLPMCDKPGCEHSDAKCNAYSEKDMYCVNRVADTIYYCSFDDSTSRIEFYSCDINGNNKTLIASDSELPSAVHSSTKYVDSYIYYSQYILENNDEYGNPIYQQGSSTCIKRVDLETGEAETLLEVSDRDAMILNFELYGDELVYTLSCDNFNEIYSFNLKTDETTKLSPDDRNIRIIGDSCNDFNPEKVFCYDLNDGMFYFLNLESGEFTSFKNLYDEFKNIAAYIINFTGSSRYMLFVTDYNDPNYTLFDLETEELTKIPIWAYYNPEAIIGEYIWFTYHYPDFENENLVFKVSVDKFKTGDYLIKP